ncbi:MAG: DMT family transporter, partial [Thaumarchaeota archaeon]|nr:DMT family transporter [Nitrososphaerota archaeon]
MIPETLLGVVLALGAATSIAAVGAFGSKPFMEFASNPSDAAYIALIISSVVLGFATLITGEAGLLLKISPQILALFAGIGIMQNAIGRRLWFVAIRHIGANQSNTLVSTEVIYSVIFAVILLGERVGVRLEVGTALVFVGALIIEGRRSAGKRSGNFLFGYETAIIAGFLFGVAPILIRYGLDAFPY